MNEMLPQPPPSEVAIRSRRWRNWIVGVGILSVIIVLGMGLFSPLVIRSRKNADLTQARSNLRQIGYNLIEFDSEYGNFPDSSTVAKVQAKHPGTTIPLGTSSSNDFFRQLLASELATSEVMFYAKTPDTHKPDNLMTGARALTKGECAFAYVVGLSSKSDPKTPVAFYPLGKGKLIFDFKFSEKHLYGKTAVLFADGSVTVFPVDKTGHVFINGKDLFDPSQPFWGGKAPVVKWPE